MRTIPSSLTICWALLSWGPLGAPASARADGDIDTKSRECAKSVVSAIQSKALDQLKALAGRPFYDKSAVITDEAGLAAALRTLIDRPAPPMAETKIVEIESYETVRKSISAKHRANVDKVLDKSDRVAVVETTLKGEKKRTLVLIKVRDGRAVFVGFAQ